MALHCKGARVFPTSGGPRCAPTDEQSDESFFPPCTLSPSPLARRLARCCLERAVLAVAGLPCPRLNRWLVRAVKSSQVSRDGTGRHNEPYRYWLPQGEEFMRPDGGSVEAMQAWNDRCVAEMFARLDQACGAQPTPEAPLSAKEGPTGVPPAAVPQAEVMPLEPEPPPDPGAEPAARPRPSHRRRRRPSPMHGKRCCACRTRSTP
jgi:hypothetical protein